MALYIFILQRLLLPVKLSPSFSNLSPHLYVLLTGYEFSFPPSLSAAFYQQSSLYRSLPSGNDLSGPWEKKGKAWKTEFHIQRRAATLINTFASASNPSFSSFHSLLSSAFTPTLSFSLRLMNGWKESKVWPLWRTGCDVFRDVRPTFCTFMKFQQFDLVQFRIFFSINHTIWAIIAFHNCL